MSLSEEGLDIAIKEKNELNDFVNEVLKKNNIQFRDIVQMDHYGSTYIFGVKIKQKKIIDEEIIDIVKLTPKENYEKYIDFFGEWPCEIPYIEYYKKTIEKSTKKMIETMIYYGLSTQKENIEFVIREFYNIIEKEDCDDLIAQFPDEHPIKNSYQDVSNINFRYVLLNSFVKMSMWQINNRALNWNFLDSEEAVTKWAKELNDINSYVIGQFIKENEKILEKQPNKYNYLFMIFYKMYSYIHNNASWVDYKEDELYECYQEDWDTIIMNYSKNLIKQIDLIEDYKFEVIFEETDVPNEKLGYIKSLYDELIKELEYDHNYEEEELYSKRYVEFLEQYIKEYDQIKVKRYLSSMYNICACCIWDKKGTINDESDQYEYKAIELNTLLAQEDSEKIWDYYLRIAVNYCNMAIEYYKAYESKTLKRKDKYVELFKKAIYYREEVAKLEEIKDIEIKIKNYFELGRINFYINEKQNSNENFEKLIQICNKNKQFAYWIDKVNEFQNNNKDD